MGIADFLKKLLLGRAFSAENGRITILGRYNVTLVESCSFAYLYQKIFELLGDKKAFELALNACEIAIKNAMDSFGVFGLRPSLSLEKMLPFTEFYGLGKFSIIDRQEKPEKNIYIIKLENSPLTEYAKKEWGKNSKVCRVIEANLIASLKLAYGKIPIVKETSCYTKGAPFCTFRIEINK